MLDIALRVSLSRVNGKINLAAVNGNGNWNAATGMAELFGCKPGENTECLPIQSFFLLGENRLPELQDAGAGSLAVLWIRARRAESLAELQQFVDALVSELGSPAFRDTPWRVVLSCLNPFVSHKFGRPIDVGKVQEPQEYSMSIRKELEQVKAEERAEGKAEGRAEGKAEGRAEGMQIMLLDTLECRFGSKVASALVERVRKISDVSILLDLSRSANRTGNPEDFEKLLAACG